jgi:hypothetical protein
VGEEGLPPTQFIGHPLVVAHIEDSAIGGAHDPWLANPFGQISQRA